jgi:hypothetical protein
MKLGDMANGIKIKGIWIIAWTFTAKDGAEVQIRTEAYHVPEAKQRLLSPHRLFKKRNESLALTVVMKTSLNSS